MVPTMALWQKHYQVASIWDSGLWYQDGAGFDWTKVSNAAPTQVTAGDVTGDQFNLDSERGHCQQLRRFLSIQRVMLSAICFHSGGDKNHLISETYHHSLR